MLLPAQRNFLKVIMRTYQTHPKKKHDLDQMSQWRKWCILITEKKSFELFILGIILINTIVLASHHFMIQSDDYVVLRTLN